MPDLTPGKLQQDIFGLRSYDVIIIGAGSAGLSAAKEVKRKTDNFLVVESGSLGTTCARVGCMPSKAFIEAANIYHQRTRFSAIGARGHGEVSIDGAAFLSHVRELRDHFVKSVIDGMEDWSGTHLVKKRARFLSPEVLDLDGEQVTAKKFIIATGTHPILPSEWKKTSDKVLTTDSIFEMQTLPKSLAVIGFGAIGLELSQAFARLGVEVTVFALGSGVGGLSDPELQTYAKKLFSRELTLINHKVDSLTEVDDSIEVKAGDQRVKVEKVLVAVGRKANIADLSLDRLGVPLDDQGNPTVCDLTFRISGSRAYMVGDVNGKRPILHEAVDQGRIAGFNSVLSLEPAPAHEPACTPNSEDQEFAPKTKLMIAFSSPNIAIVGASYQELVDRRGKSQEQFVEGRASFENQGRAVTKLANAGVLKIYGDLETGKILGAELIAPNGEHLAHLLAWAIASELDAVTALSRPFYHPVLEEAVRTALRDLSRKVSKQRESAFSIRCEDPPAGCP